MSSLKEKIKPLTGSRKQFLLMRIAGLEPAVCRQLVGASEGAYNSWLNNETFRDLYRQLPDLEYDYKQEAIQILRRENQLEAVLLEGKIIKRMKEELESGEYVLLRTHIAREVYSKLITDLDTIPQAPPITWDQRIGIILGSQQIPQGEIINAECTEISCEQNEHQESYLVEASEQTTNEAQKRA